MSGLPFLSMVAPECLSEVSSSEDSDLYEELTLNKDTYRSIGPGPVMMSAAASHQPVQAPSREAAYWDEQHQHKGQHKVGKVAEGSSGWGSPSSADSAVSAFAQLGFWDASSAAEVVVEPKEEPMWLNHSDALVSDEAAPVLFAEIHAMLRALADSQYGRGAVKASPKKLKLKVRLCKGGSETCFVVRVFRGKNTTSTVEFQRTGTTGAAGVSCFFAVLRRVAAALGPRARPYSSFSCCPEPLSVEYPTPALVLPPTTPAPAPAPDVVAAVFVQLCDVLLQGPFDDCKQQAAQELLGLAEGVAARALPPLPEEAQAKLVASLGSTVGTEDWELRRCAQLLKGGAASLLAPQHLHTLHQVWGEDGAVGGQPVSVC